MSSRLWGHWNLHRHISDECKRALVSQPPTIVFRTALCQAGGPPFRMRSLRASQNDSEHGSSQEAMRLARVRWRTSG
eukprot:4859940-Pyramimonas_sp.AAC.1